MTTVTHEHLAELMIGFARSQRALIRAIAQDSPQMQMAVIGSIQAEAAMAHQPTLRDLPSRVLLQIAGGGHPQQLDDWLRGELERLTG